MTQLVLTKESSNEQIKQYFDAVLKIQQSGEEFPVSLDDVWPLVYSEKGKAVRALKNDFIESVDYLSFAQNGKREIGATVIKSYTLSSSCFEFFIARKVRPVFEVYRQVFHKATNPKISLDTISRKDIARMLYEAEEEKEIMAEQMALVESENQKNKPFVDFAKTVSEVDECLKIEDYAKVIYKDTKMGRNKLFEWMRDKGILQLNNKPYQKYITAGYFKVSEKTFDRGGVSVPYTLTLITGKGQIAIHRKFMRDESL